MSAQTKLSASALARRREIARVWNLLHPKPMELRRGRRRFLREGPLKQWSPVQKRVKKKYVFLFSDCLLITRKDNSHTYWMKIFCFLSSIKDIQFVPGQAYGKVPDVEFRIVTAKKTLIFFGASKTETDTWIRDLNYARGGCKGKPPPSVWQYGDEDDGQDDEIDISHEQFPAEQISVASTPPAAPKAVTAIPSAQPTDGPNLIDLSGAHSAFNPFGTGAPAAVSFDATGFDAGRFDPFGLDSFSAVPGGAPGGAGVYAAGGPGGYGAAPGTGMSVVGPGGATRAFDPNSPLGMGIDFSSFPGAPGAGVGQAGGPGSAAGIYGGGAPAAAPTPAPVFLPDAAKGAAQVASELVRYLEQMPPGLRNPSIISSTQRAKEASDRLQAAIQAFALNPNPETGRQLQQAAAEAALLVSQLMGEATVVAESQPPDDYKRQLAAAVHLTALSLEQLVNASSNALDHYTQQEHQRALQAQAHALAQAQAIQAEAEARARAEEEQRQAMLQLQAQQAQLAQQKAQMEEAEHARLLAIQQEKERALAAEQARLQAAQEAQRQQEAQLAQQAYLAAMSSVPAAMESVALAITAAGEKLAAAAAAAAAKAAADSSQVVVGAGQIVKDTSSIVSLTANLIRVATEAQAEVTLAMGSPGTDRARYHDDPVWREGLISAAQDVGTNIELLVTAASEATEHNGPLEMLMAALRQVNGATARLVTAARAKMAPDSATLPRLGGAASAVKQASLALEQTAITTAKDRAPVQQESAPAPERHVSASAAHIERMEKLAQVARLERELEEARRRVSAITKAQYDRM